MYFKRPLVGLAAIALATLTACVPAEQQASFAADSEATQSNLEPIRVALDWSLNTNHIGLVVAEDQGYFSEAGTDVKILPLGTTTPIEQISAGEADFGIAEQTGIQISGAQGHEITSVF